MPANKPINPSRKKPATPIYKPTLGGAVGGKQLLAKGRRVLLYLLVSYFIYLLFGSVLTFDSTVLRVGANLLLLAAMGAFLYMDAISWGESDAAYGEILFKRKAEGHTPDQQDVYRAFHPLKGFAAALLGVLPILILAIVYAFMAEKQVYSLQSLPNWVSGYTNRAEIGGALAYYENDSTLQAVDILRIFVRMSIYPYINMAGSRNTDLILLVDRLSPLCVLLLPTAYGIGYTQGKRARAMVHGSIAAGVKRVKRRERKAREARRSNQPEQLT